MARYSNNGSKQDETEWFDRLPRFGVVGTIDTTRLVPSLKIIDGPPKKRVCSVSKMRQLILDNPLEGAHRAGTDVDGVVNIFCDARVTEKRIEVPSAIIISAWLAHNNHSKPRLVWETKMKAEVAAEHAEETIACETATSKVRADDGGWW